MIARMRTILAISTSAEMRADLERALARYGSDYDIVVTDGSGAADAIGSAEAIAVALAPIGNADFEALRAVRSVHANARCIAVVGVGDTSVADDLRRALTLGQVDYYVGHPWASPDQELHPVVSEALRRVAADNLEQFEKLVVVDTDRQGRGGEIVSWLNRNGVATRFVEAATEEGRDRLASADVAEGALPAAFLYDGRVLIDPSNAELVEAMGARTRPSSDTYDIAIIGAGPAGLAAAVYGASEGLSTVVVDRGTVGGQAASSANIRNYLGFRWGVRGVDLAVEASNQAEQLGAEFVLAHDATGITVDGDERVVVLSSGDRIRCGAVIIAGGVAYRRLGVPEVDALIGRGVFYGASAGEATAMEGLRVVILGGGNSAGQAAAQLAAVGAEVVIAIRGDDLGAKMSDYLVEQLQGMPGVSTRCNTSVTGAVGEHQLAGLRFTDTVTGETVEEPVDALYVFIGAQPHTEWLRGVVDLDAAGYVVTGSDGAGWLETSMPGVFAAGDIRSGSIKRVAAAVGEGSTAAMLALELRR